MFTKLVFNFKESTDLNETFDPVLNNKIQDEKGTDETKGYLRKGYIIRLNSWDMYHGLKILCPYHDSNR